MSIEDLGKALTVLPVVTRVEEQGKLAIVTVDDTTLLDAPTRRRLVELARTHGYSHVCVELPADRHATDVGKADPSLRSG